MKNLLLAVITVFAFAASSNAQTSYGVKAGLNLANLASSAEGFESKARIGFHIGGYAEFALSDKFSFLSELVYSSQGAKEEDFETAEYMGETYTSSYKAETKLNYINIPVLAKFKPTESFYLAAGPQIGLLLGANTEWSYSYSDSSGSESDSGDEDIKEFLNSTDIGVAIAAGYELESGLNFGLRYNYGLTDIVDESDGDAIKNSTIQVSVGFKLTSY